MPRFTTECADALERAGIDLEDAVADFDAGKDRDETDDVEMFRYGRLGVYLYERRIVFGRRENIVMHVWPRRKR